MYELELRPKGWFHRRVELHLDGRLLPDVQRRAFCQGGEFRVDGRGYRVRATGFWRSRYELLRGTEVVAEARPVGFWCSNHEIVPGSRRQAFLPLRTRRAGFLRDGVELFQGGERVGRACRRGLFAMGRRLELAEHLPLELGIFIGLVVLAVADSEAAVAGGAGGGAVAASG